LSKDIKTRIDENTSIAIKKAMPCHLNPVKREIALAVRFKSTLERGEDTDYSKRMLIRLRKEVSSNAVYKYLFRRTTKEYNFGYRTYHL
jgi:hypothetical protein